MILIIDDDIAVRTSLALLLENEKYKVMTTGEPAEALKWMEHKAPELIILDLNFSIATSGDEGMKLLRQVKELNPAIPVILITGWATIELAVRGMKLGANDFINKPWNNDHILQSVKTLLDLKERKVQSHSRRQLDELYNFHQII